MSNKQLMNNIEKAIKLTYWQYNVATNGLTREN